jgi:hypothetical protein
MAHSKSLRVAAAARRDFGRPASPIEVSMATRFKYRLIIVFIAANYPVAGGINFQFEKTRFRALLKRADTAHKMR